MRRYHSTSAGRAQRVLPPSCSDMGPVEVRPFVALRVTATATVILSEAKNRELYTACERGRLAAWLDALIADSSPYAT